MKLKLMVLALCGTTFLSGCAVFAPGDSDFSCPGMPKGVTCKTPREAYNISLNKPPKKSKYDTGSLNLNPVEVSLVGREGANLEPVPVLEQAKVMRIWISPWIDKNKDLHWPGVIFTQVTSRQWQFGDDGFEGVEPPVPHRHVSAQAAPLASKDDKQQQQDGGAKVPFKAQDEPLN